MLSSKNKVKRILTMCYPDQKVLYLFSFNATKILRYLSPAIPDYLKTHQLALD